MEVATINTINSAKDSGCKRGLSTQTPLYSLGEEIANAITHGVGAGLSVAALVLLIVKAATSAPDGAVGGGNRAAAQPSDIQSSELRCSCCI